MAKFSYRSKLSPNEREELLIIFFKSLACIKSPKEAAQVISDLMSPQELDMIAKRLAIARELLAGRNYQEIIRDLKVSNGTIARVNAWLNEAGEGFRLISKRVSGRVKQIGKDSIMSDDYGLTQFRRKYPSYFWPEKLLEQIVKSADKKQKQQLRTIIKQSRHKTKLLKQINSLLKQ